MEEKYQVLDNLFKDDDVAKKLLSLTPEEAVTFLQEQYHLTFSVEELNDVASGMKAALSDNGDELTNDQLDEVAGGGKGSGAYNAGYYIGKTIKVVGTAAGIAKVAIAIGLITW